MLTQYPQFEGQLRTLVMFFAGLALGRGWITSADHELITGVATAALAIVGMVWSWWVNRPAALVQAAATADVVEQIKLDPRKEESFGINRDTGPKVIMTSPPPERKFD